MGTSYRSESHTDDQTVLLTSLRDELKLLKEGNPRHWELQQQINAIIAQRFLQELNT